MPPKQSSVAYDIPSKPKKGKHVKPTSSVYVIPSSSKKGKHIRPTTTIYYQPDPSYPAREVVYITTTIQKIYRRPHHVTKVWMNKGRTVTDVKTVTTTDTEYQPVVTWKPRHGWGRKGKPEGRVYTTQATTSSKVYKHGYKPVKPSSRVSSTPAKKSSKPGYPGPYTASVKTVKESAKPSSDAGYADSGKTIKTSAKLDTPAKESPKPAYDDGWSDSGKTIKPSGASPPKAYKRSVKVDSAKAVTGAASKQTVGFSMVVVAGLLGVILM
ncbi:hypothetical protein EJ06DRAFT_518979 [Trichodelitschia bisporula]|uniref:Uncharacterized protein n=1 Tax=Trichodelitschia bisporula TaxID=703511 RepID=A0A6G1I8K9_9PEZI|nr:hypothetical protein EJ06DRAFT_518979 [Trichodelitschia bisporula]